MQDLTTLKTWTTLTERRDVAMQCALKLKLDCWCPSDCRVNERNERRADGGTYREREGGWLADIQGVSIKLQKKTYIISKVTVGS